MLKVLTSKTFIEKFEGDLEDCLEEAERLCNETHTHYAIYSHRRNIEYGIRWDNEQVNIFKM